MTLDDWAKSEWGNDLTRLPNRDALLNLARKKPKFKHVSQADIRALRQRLAPDEIKKGGGRMHDRKLVN